MINETVMVECFFREKLVTTVSLIYWVKNIPLHWENPNQETSRKGKKKEADLEENKSSLKNLCVTYETLNI